MNQIWNENFYTETNFFNFLRQTPRLVTWGEGTNQLIAQFAAMTPPLSAFWYRFLEVLKEGEDEWQDWQDGNIAYVERDIHWNLIVKQNALSPYFFNNFHQAYQDFRPRDAGILTENGWENHQFPFHLEIEWEQVVETFEYYVNL